MFTAAQCGAIAKQKLAQAARDNRHRRRLTAAAEAWFFLGTRLSGEDIALSTQGAVKKTRSKTEPTQAAVRDINDRRRGRDRK
jgi:hypothetical protein